MNRLSKFLQGARMFWGRWGGFCSRRAVSNVGAPAKDVLKPRTVFQIHTLSVGSVFVLICLLSMDFIPVGLCAQEFEARGRLYHKYSPSREKGPAPYENYSDFVVFLRGCEWLICATNDRHTEIEYFEAGKIDGGSVLTMAFDVSAEENDAKQGRFTKISGLPFPRFAECDEMPLLWFAYASMCDTKQVSPKGRFEEINSLHTDGLVGHLSRVRDVYMQVSPELPNLVLSAAWLESNTAVTTAVYRCTSSIKVNRLMLPKSWEYEIFDRSTRNVVHSYHVEVTAYEPVLTVQSLSPRLSPKRLETMVSDYRFAVDRRQRIPEVKYNVRDAWLTREELKKSSMYKDAARVAIHQAEYAARTTAQSTGKRLLIFGIFGGVTVIFLVWGLVKRIKTTETMK